MTERRNDLAQTAAAGNLSAAAAASPLSGETGETALTLRENVEKLGEYLLNMGKMIARMQRRMDELEAQQAAVTVRHADVTRLNAEIRTRAGEICDRYGLTDAESAKVIRTAIKKATLARYGVRDLHDLPAAHLGGAEDGIRKWTNVRLVMERRAKLEGGTAA